MDDGSPLPHDRAAAFASRRVFFCGIGGSGMLPLAQILKGLGFEVSGSDRSRDQGRTPEKFAWLEEHGFALSPQDGSGLTSAQQTLIASAAIEDSVPDIARANQLGCARLTRAEALSRLFNQSEMSVAIGGTSGKSTVTGMIGAILHHAGLDPTIMNGAVMKDFVTKANPFASSRVGSRSVFVSEVDESDGSIAFYTPTIGVLLNVSLDHKSLEELRKLFSNFVRIAQMAVVNFDNQEARLLTRDAKGLVSFGVTHANADITVAPASIEQGPFSIRAKVVDNRSGAAELLTLPLPGHHNLSNALAAIAAASAAGVSLPLAVEALQNFKGLARRFDVIGTSTDDITVIDDFGHNPEKCAATLRTLKGTPGRVIAFFQPHGFGPLKQMGDELAETFARELATDDVTIMCDPVYFGGTVDRSVGSERVVDLIRNGGGQAEYIPLREDCGNRILELAEAGDRIVVMGARDDTLTDFAKSLMARINSRA